MDSLLPFSCTTLSFVPTYRFVPAYFGRGTRSFSSSKQFRTTFVWDLPSVPTSFRRRGVEPFVNTARPPPHLEIGFKWQPASLWMVDIKDHKQIHCGSLHGSARHASMTVLRSESFQQGSVSGNGATRCTGPFAISAVVCPLRLTAATSAPFSTRYRIIPLYPRAAAWCVAVEIARRYPTAMHRAHDCERYLHIPTSGKDSPDGVWARSSGKVRPVAGKPATFDFLGFTHISKRSHGRCSGPRRTDRWPEACHLRFSWIHAYLEAKPRPLLRPSSHGGMNSVEISHRPAPLRLRQIRPISCSLSSTSARRRSSCSMR